MGFYQGNGQYGQSRYPDETSTDSIGRRGQEADPLEPISAPPNTEANNDPSQRFSGSNGVMPIAGIEERKFFIVFHGSSFS